MVGRQQLGYEVHLKLVDEKITPQNRLICGRWTGESGGGTSFLPHEAAAKTYDRVHGRKRAAPPLAGAAAAAGPCSCSPRPVLWRVRLRLVGRFQDRSSASARARHLQHLPDEGVGERRAARIAVELAPAEQVAAVGADERLDDLIRMCSFCWTTAA